MADPNIIPDSIPQQEQTSVEPIAAQPVGPELHLVPSITRQKWEMVSQSIAEARKAHGKTSDLYKNFITEIMNDVATRELSSDEKSGRVRTDDARAVEGLLQDDLITLAAQDRTLRKHLRKNLESSLAERPGDPWFKIEGNLMVQEAVYSKAVDLGTVKEKSVKGMLTDARTKLADLKSTYTQVNTTLDKEEEEEIAPIEAVGITPADVSVNTTEFSSKPTEEEYTKNLTDAANAAKQFKDHLGQNYVSPNPPEWSDTLAQAADSLTSFRSGLGQNNVLNQTSRPTSSISSPIDSKLSKPSEAEYTATLAAAAVAAEADRKKVIASAPVVEKRQEVVNDEKVASTLESGREKARRKMGFKTRVAAAVGIAVLGASLQKGVQHSETPAETINVPQGIESPALQNHEPAPYVLPTDIGNSSVNLTESVSDSENSQVETSTENINNASSDIIDGTAGPLGVDNSATSDMGDGTGGPLGTGNDATSETDDGNGGPMGADNGATQETIDGTAGPVIASSEDTSTENSALDQITVQPDATANVLTPISVPTGDNVQEVTAETQPDESVFSEIAPTNNSTEHITPSNTSASESETSSATEEISEVNLVGVNIENPGDSISQSLMEENHMTPEEFNQKIYSNPEIMTGIILYNWNEFQKAWEGKEGYPTSLEDFMELVKRAESGDVQARSQLLATAQHGADMVLVGQEYHVGYTLEDCQKVYNVLMDAYTENPAGFSEYLENIVIDDQEIDNETTTQPESPAVESTSVNITPANSVASEVTTPTVASTPVTSTSPLGPLASAAGGGNDTVSHEPIMPAASPTIEPVTATTGNEFANTAGIPSTANQSTEQVADSPKSNAGFFGRIKNRLSGK